MAEQLFASFILDGDHELELAIEAASVIEATPISGNIQPLPASVPFLEGIMHLRDTVIPILNLKKRLGLQNTGYGKDAKIAVVAIRDQSFGLLFDDIREVLRIDDTLLRPVQPALQSADCIISDLITLGKKQRTLEVLNLQRLFPENSLLFSQSASTSQTDPTRSHTYSRYVVFSADGREYGIPVENSREITFLADIDEAFKTGCLEGALQLRGRTVPVMHATSLLRNITAEHDVYGELCRVLIMATDSLIFGMIIDEIREILTVADDTILPMPLQGELSVAGICEPVQGRNIMLLNVEHLIASQKELLNSMSRINSDGEEEEKAVVIRSRHLITKNCYLIFSIGRKFAIELQDVQEIIEQDKLMTIPAATGFDSEVINLRGQIVPVINLRQFYEYPENDQKTTAVKLIICQDGDQVIGLQVDTIVTIYKQEQFYATPSLNQHLQSKKDTLDRLIEFVNEESMTEHVLVVNVRNMINNHLRQDSSIMPQSLQDVPAATQNASWSEN